jgi:hypothetical protein
MSKTKIAGLESWDLPAGGQSREAKDRALYEKERGLDSASLNESAEGQAALKKREATFMKALGIEVKNLEKKTKEGSLELNDLVEIEKRVKVMKDDLVLRESAIANSDQPDLMRAIKLYESWQDSKISVEELLEGIRDLGLA